MFIRSLKLLNNLWYVIIQVFRSGRIMVVLHNFRDFRDFINFFPEVVLRSPHIRSWPASVHRIETCKQIRLHSGKPATGKRSSFQKRNSDHVSFFASPRRDDDGVLGRRRRSGGGGRLELPSQVHTPPTLSARQKKIPVVFFSCGKHNPPLMNHPT